jgi:Calcineurin-like phosphoesterase
MNGGKRLCTFVHISDLHFAEGDPFTGNSELDDQPPSWDHWHLFDGILGHQYRALRDFEHVFGNLRDEEKARLIVTGDLTACARYDRIPSCNQFRIANDYMAREWQVGTLAAVGLHLGRQEATEFRIPGNHDHWGGNTMSPDLPGTIFGGPTLGFYDAFKRTPFVCKPIALRSDCSLVFAGIDSDADTSDYYRLLARGDFESQLNALAAEMDKCGKPDGSQIRVLLMHHSPMYWSPNLYHDLEITRPSFEALGNFVREYDIAVILTGHIHLHGYSLTALNPGGTGNVLEVRCGTTTVCDAVPPGWKSPRTATYRLPPDTFLVHRLYEVAAARGKTRIEWRTDWYLRSRAGFINHNSALGNDPVIVWPRPPRPPALTPRTPAAQGQRTTMSKIQRTELCSIWENFARNPANPRVAEIARQRRHELLAHIYDCDTCSRAKISSARSHALITEFIGFDRVLTREEINQIDAMRNMADDDEKKAARIGDLLEPQSREEFVRQSAHDPTITSLARSQAVRAITMLAARTVRRLASRAAQNEVSLYFYPDGTLEFPGGTIPSATVIKEIALTAVIPTDSACNLVSWLCSAAKSRPNLFEGFRCQAEREKVLMISQRPPPRSEDANSPMNRRRIVSIGDLTSGLKAEIAAVKRDLRQPSQADHNQLAWRQKSLEGLLQGSQETRTRLHPVRPTPATRTRSHLARRARTLAATAELKTKFSGQVTVISDNPLLPRYSKAVDFELIFSADRTQVSASKIVISENSITVKSDPATGRFDLKTGEFDLPARFLVTGSPETADFSFAFDPPLGISTEKGTRVGPFLPKGKRLDQKIGKIILAGAATIRSAAAIVNDTNLMFNAVGTIDPVP